MQVYMTKPQLQSLIARNKEQIIKLGDYRDWETDRKSVV